MRFERVNCNSAGGPRAAEVVDITITVSPDSTAFTFPLSRAIRQTASRDGTAGDGTQSLVGVGAGWIDSTIGTKENHVFHKTTPFSTGVRQQGREDSRTHLEQRNDSDPQEVKTCQACGTHCSRPKWP